MYLIIDNKPGHSGYMSDIGIGQTVWCVNCSADLDGSLLAPAVDETLSSDDRLAAVKSVLHSAEPRCHSDRMATIFDTKEQYKMLCRCCGIAPRMQYVDPKVACWLLDPSSNEKNLHCLVTNYCPLEAGLLQGQLVLPVCTIHDITVSK